MAKRRQWSWAPDRRLKPRVPDEVQAEVQRRADELLEQHLKPRYVKRPPRNPRRNYLTGSHTKWHRSFFYVVGDHASPGPDALSPTFESPLARLEYTPDGRFSLAYMRHTGKWREVHRGLTLDQAVKSLREEGLFHPA